METQKSISEWVEATFGPPSPPYHIASRMNIEVAEVVHAVVSEKGADAIAEECADVAIILLRLVDRLGMKVTLNRVVSVENSIENFAFLASADSAALLRALRNKDQSNELLRLFLSSLGDDLNNICHLLGRDLQEEIDAKMAINRTRTRSQKGSQHIEVDNA